MKVLNKMLNWSYALLLGGYINAICIVKYSYTVSFYWNISKTAINISQGNFNEVFKVLTIIAALLLNYYSGSLVDGRI